MSIASTSIFDFKRVFFSPFHFFMMCYKSLRCEERPIHWRFSYCSFSNPSSLWDGEKDKTWFGKEVDFFFFYALE